MPNFVRNIVSGLPADKKAQLDQAIAALKEKKDEFSGSMKQQFDNLKNSDAFKRVGILRDHLHNVASALGKAVADRDAKTAALEDNRSSGPVTDKTDVVPDGVA